MLYRNQEYWPDLGQSILVKRFPSWKEGQLSFAALERGVPEVLSGRNSRPQGLSAPEWGVVTEHRAKEIQVRLEDSGDTGMVRADLVNNDPELCDEEYWPQPGERVRVACLGVWPDGELRMTMRNFFVDMLEKPQFHHLAPHAPTHRATTQLQDSRDDKEIPAPDTPYPNGHDMGVQCRGEQYT
ncbi:hypothetical protein [Actinomyces sp. ZJ751]|nr:hypothetical protein [Actinomyces sp. ZJ751]